MNRTVNGSDFDAQQRLPCRPVVMTVTGASLASHLEEDLEPGGLEYPSRREGGLGASPSRKMLCIYIF